jgi:hypothetical protein
LGAGDLSAGLPHPERVWQWWREQGADILDTAHHARHGQNGRQTTDRYGSEGVGHPSSQPPTATSHRERDGLSDGVAGDDINVADKAPAGETARVR